MRNLYADRIRPYNELWLDCINNNLISMFMCWDESFKDMIFFADVSYRRKLPESIVNNDELLNQFLREGFFTPKVVYTIELMDRLTEKKRSVLVGDWEVLNEIKTALQNDYCVFVTVDRYFYPSGREAGKLHMIHPVFIYDYDDFSETLKTIEDCMVPGTLAYYDLPYRSLLDSCRDFVEKGQSVEITACKPAFLAKSLVDIDPPLRKIARMCEELLDENGKAHEYNLVYQTGIKALSDYSDQFVAFIAALEEFSLYKLRVFQFQQLHGRNVKLLRFLRQAGHVRDSRLESLSERYQDLHDRWRSFKDRSFIELARKKVNKTMDHNRLMELSNQLKEIVQRETDTARRLHEVILRSISREGWE